MTAVNFPLKEQLFNIFFLKRMLIDLKWVGEKQIKGIHESFIGEN